MIVPGETRRVRPDPQGLEPIFPRARLLSVNVSEAEQATARARAELEAACAEAAKLREVARAEIAQARAALEREAIEMRAAAVEQGGREGRECWAALVGRLDREINRLQSEVPHDVQELALLVARKVLDVEFAVRPDALLALVRDVLNAAKLYREITVVLNPADYGLVVEHAEALKRGLLAADTFEIRADPDMPRHGVRLVTNRGLRDGSVETQLAILARRLTEHAAAGSDDPEPLA